jgi:hypothetical protein
MMQLATVYESLEILAPLVRRLTWTHFLQFIALQAVDERQFLETLAM